MNEIKILAVEDDRPVRNLITTTLKASGYRYLTADDGEEAVMEAATQNPDIILLDLGLPNMDGIDVIRKIRTWSNVPIIVISARTEDADKVEALDAGADDYLTKPFSVQELLARIRVTHRRLNFLAGQTPSSESVFTNGALEIDYAAGVVRLNGEEIHLTPNEYRLLTVLSKNVGKVMTYRTITRAVWGSGWENNMASLRVFMASLRKKIENHAGGAKYIETHVGVGYQMLRQ